MNRITFFSAIWMLCLPLVGLGQPVAYESPITRLTEIEKIWPKSQLMPRGLKLFNKTRLSQNLSISNGRDTRLIVPHTYDDISINAPTRFNPNRFFPIAVPGGLHNVAGWEGKLAVSIPQDKHVNYWEERIEAGARHPLPKYSWDFPEGTTFVELFTYNGKVFEIRQLTKDHEGWIPTRPFRDRESRPPGYDGVLGQSCLDCHNRAGQWVQYGTLWRGSSGVYSAPILEAIRGENDWPIKRK